MRGGEKVLEGLCELFPQAEIFTLLHVPGSVSATIERHRIHTSLLQYLPQAKRCYRQALLLFPLLIERFELDNFDLIISSSHCVAKAAVPPRGALHLCYCHTPMRYAWDQFDAYFGRARLGAIRSRIMRRLMDRMAEWDRRTAARVTHFLTNSRFVAKRISQYYHREASVVYPPVDTDFFQPRPVVPRRSALIVSALVPYKRIEIAIDACHLAGVPLRIVGIGPERRALERRAAEVGGDVQFIGRVSNDELRDLYCEAGVVLLPGEEDFGIVPLEAQACGRPVVALAAGGALESVVPNDTGILVNDAEPAAFADAVRQALDRPWDSHRIRAHAEQFRRAVFLERIRAAVATLQDPEEQPYLASGHAVAATKGR